MGGVNVKMVYFHLEGNLNSFSTELLFSFFKYLLLYLAVLGFSAPRVILGLH